MNTEVKTYKKHINDLTPKERARIDKINEARAKKRGKFKVKSEIKYASDAERGISVDRPKKMPPEVIVVDVERFRTAFIEAIYNRLRKVKRRDLTVALAQLQDQANAFDPKILKELRERGIELKRTRA